MWIHSLGTRGFVAGVDEVEEGRGREGIGAEEGDGAGRTATV